LKKGVIIGCGYIGCELAKKLIKELNFDILATTNNPKNLEKLNKITQKTTLLKSSNIEEITPLLKDCDYIFLTMTSDYFNTYEETFLNTVNSIVKAAKKFKNKKTLVYTSRMTVYGEQNGLWVDENSKLNPLTEASKILIETEKILLSLKKLTWNVCILSLAEVYGPHFEISKKIKKSSDYFLPGTGDNYTNMIHLDDIINAIIYAINHTLNGIYNLSDDTHTTQKELLNEVSKKLNLPEITWQKILYKTFRGNFRVSNNKIKSAGYTFIHPNRIIS
jgi:nucleoside-diphosphate-sugar epimerase